MATATGALARDGSRPLNRAVVELDGLTQRAGRAGALARALDFDVDRDEFLAVLGPNGAGKSTLLRLILGLVKPTVGCVLVEGEEPARDGVGSATCRSSARSTVTCRSVDATSSRSASTGIASGFAVLVLIGALSTRRSLRSTQTAFADRPVGRLSGGEQQRLRIAQLLAQQPELILADEPLLSLDLAQQQNVIALLDAQRRTARTPVIFVTHDVNPLLPYVDRVLYLSGDGWAAGRVDDVLTSETLSRLYRAPVDVLRVRGRVIVVGTPETGAHHH